MILDNGLLFGATL